MIKIVLLLFLFLVYVSAQREGLRNYQPITKDNQIYGVNVIKGNPQHICDRLANEKDPLFKDMEPKLKEKILKYSRADVLMDMQYFNNASYLIFQLNN